jgi:hypothetical protein
VVLLVFLVSETQKTSAQDVAPVLRGRGLEIVDDAGRVRASISTYRSGETYSDIVVFRLHDRRGKPMVKLDTHEAGPGNTLKGSGLGLLGDSDDVQAYIGTEGPVSALGLKNSDGKRHRVEP